MSESDAVLSFTGADAPSLEAAVDLVIHRAELAERLHQGAMAAVSDEESQSAAGRRFQILLELGYLVASADGLADAERASLAHLLETVTQRAIDVTTLDEHFQDLDQGVRMLGRHHRVAAAAAQLGDVQGAEEAIVLVTLVAVADGELARDEFEVIESIGKHAGVEADRVKELIDEVASQIKEALG